MNRLVVRHHFVAGALIFLGVSACGDAENNPAAGAGSGGATSGAGGMAGEAGHSGGRESEGGDGGAPTGGAPEGGGVNEGGGGAGGAGGIGSGATGSSDTTTVPPKGSCLKDADCNDEVYCNGVEKCRPLLSGSDVRVCMAPLHGPCAADTCDEEAKHCDCIIKDGDSDGDGFKAAGCVHGTEPADCDDDNKDRNPALQEVCDLTDPTHDEDCNDATYAGDEADVDGDTYLDATCSNFLAYQPIGASPEQFQKTSGSDCNDDDPQSNPSAPEICDGLDNNCNGVPDEFWGTPLENRKTYYKDADGDYWGDTNQPLESLCSVLPVGYALNAGDCDDSNPQVAPGRAEICNGIDDNCDDSVDQPQTPGTLMLDEPYDGGSTEFECKGEDGWSVKKCPPDRLNCGDESYLDGCETIGTTLCNCHACGNTCLFSCGDEACAEIQAVSGGLWHTCLLVQPSGASTGSVACMGLNNMGQLGLGTTKDVRVPVAVPDLVGLKALAAGRSHTCATTEQGRGYCWGSNEFGQLGGIFVASSPYPVEIVRRFSDDKVEQLAAGAFHTCAIYHREETPTVIGIAGGIVCWGSGEYGQLGNGSEGDGIVFAQPVGVEREVDLDTEFLTGATQVAAGDRHTCALVSGKVQCWGSNQWMQLGVDPTDLPSAPYAVLVPGLEDLAVNEIAAAGNNTCVRAGVEVYCWGDNHYHQLGPDDGLMGLPTKIALPRDIVAIAMGPSFGCALRESGEIQCWGANVYGERGSDDATPGIEPTPIPLTGAIRIFGGDGSQVCALKADGSAWCWGQNDYGQLGNGGVSPTGQSTARRVSPLNGSQLCPE